MPLIESRADIAIITMRPDEYEAVRQRLPQTVTVHHELAYVTATVPTKKTPQRVALTRALHQGNNYSQNAAEAVIRDLAPRWILLVGIAGGFPSEDYSIGDVLVSSRFLDWTRESQTDTDVEYDIAGGDLEEAARRVVSLLPMISSLGAWNDSVTLGAQRPTINHAAPKFKTTLELWQQGILKSLTHHARYPRDKPLALPGPIVASDRLVKSAVIASDLKRFARSSVSVEMESWGVYVATNRKLPFLTIRGVSDIIGLERDASWTQYACDTAASFALLTITCGELESSTIPGPPPREPPTGTAPTPTPHTPTPPAATGPQGSLLLSLSNVLAFGDTDVLPFPFELRAFKESPHLADALLRDTLANFDSRLSAHPPHHERTLVRSGYTGFRWVTQLDPLWNLVFLESTIAIAPDIEARRLPVGQAAVFSHRFHPDPNRGRLFDDEYGWPAFRSAVAELTTQYPFAVRTDIADFYSRVSHARLRDLLFACDSQGVATDRLVRLLANYSPTAIGLPIGGPAARILAELALDNVDHILASRGIRFVRFADDYVLFSQSLPEAEVALTTIAHLLYEHEGLSLQKLKTRLLSAAELRSSLMLDEDPELDANAVSFLRLPLRFNPYAGTAEEDYALLRSHVAQFDIVAMLAREMRKTRAHDQLTRRLISAVKFLEPGAKEGAALTLIESLDLLSTLTATVFLVLRSVYPELEEKTQEHIDMRVRQVLTEGANLRNLDRRWRLTIDSERAFALRLLALSVSSADDAMLASLYNSTKSAIIRRDTILLRLQSGARHLLSELGLAFGSLPRWERRAALAGSYALSASGAAFRQGLRPAQESKDQINRTNHRSVRVSRRKIEACAPGAEESAC